MPTASTVAGALLVDAVALKVPVKELAIVMIW
jgi:hypothetical protein